MWQCRLLRPGVIDVAVSSTASKGYGSVVYCVLCENVNKSVSEQVSVRHVVKPEPMCDKLIQTKCPKHFEMIVLSSVKCFTLGDHQHVAEADVLKLVTYLEGRGEAMSSSPTSGDLTAS